MAPAASAPVLAPSALPTPVGQRFLRIQAVAKDKSMEGADVTVKLAQDLSVVASDLKLDGEGVVMLPITDAVKPGVVFLVSAERGSTELSGLYTVPAGTEPARSADRVLAQAPFAIPFVTTWFLDLATTVVTRKLASKLADVQRTLPPNASLAAVDALAKQIDDLVAKTRAQVAAATSDLRVQAAIVNALASSNNDTAEDLANALVQFSDLQQEFVNVVEACNEAVFENFKAGGPVILPAPWQVIDVIVLPPQIRALGRNIVEISYGDKSFTFATEDAARAVEEIKGGSTDTRTNTTFGQVNTSVVLPNSRPSNPDVVGKVTVGGTPRGQAMVQLTRVSDGAVVAKTSSSSDGAYAFYGISDGYYYLIVAVDGAVQETRLIQVGSPSPTPPPPA